MSLSLTEPQLSLNALGHVMQNHLYFHGNQACYNGSRNRYHGYHGLTGSQFEGKMAYPPAGVAPAYSTVPRPSGGGRAYGTLPAPAGGGG